MNDRYAVHGRPNAPHPFALAAWKTNLIPTTDLHKTIVWLCAIASVAFGLSTLDLLEANGVSGVEPRPTHAGSHTIV